MQKEKTRNETRWETMISRFTEIPDNRKTATPENLRWFLRSGAIMLRNYPEMQDAVYLAQKALDGSR